MRRRGCARSSTANWYGSERFVDRWWPLALEAWHGAFRARTEALLTDRGIAGKVGSRGVEQR